MIRYFIFSFLLVLNFTLSAQKAVLKTDTVKGRVFQYVQGDPMKTRIYTLENGLTVMLSVNRDAPRIYTCIGTRAGSKNDPKDATGLAHYLEHMLFKGTDKYGSLDYSKEKIYLDQIDSLYYKYSKTKDEAKRKMIYHQIDSVSGLAAKYAIANEYDKMLQHIGAQGTNAFTSFDQTVYINDIPSNRINDWLDIESERFRNPILRLFHTELEAVYEEKNISLDSDDDKVFEKLFEELFKRHTYGTQTTIGTIDHLKNPSLQKIREFYANWYVPNNMVISMAGAFDYDEVIELIDKAFGSFKSKEVPKFSFSPEKERNEPTVISVYGPESEYVTIGYRLPAPSKEESAIMKVTEMLISNEASGLFDLNLTKKQKVLEASAGIYMLNDYSILYMVGRPKTGQSLSEVKELMIAQLDSLKRGKFSSKEMEAIILNSSVDKTREIENNTGRAFKMVDAFIQKTPWNEVVEETEMMRSVTYDDIIRFSKKWLKNDYVVINKLVGEDTNSVKIDKPEITPVEVNRNSMSRFTKNILDNESKSIKPVFIDYTKDFVKSVIHPQVDMLSVQNKQNDLFSLFYVFEFGKYSDQQLPYAVELLQYLGSDKLSSEEISKEFYSLGCSFNVFAGSEQTYISLNGPQEKFERALSTLEHLLARAVPNQEALNSMIEDELQNREDSKSNKYAIRNALSAYVRYGSDNPVNWVLSSKKLKKLKASTLTNKIHELTSYPHSVLYYGPESADVVSKTVIKYHKLPTQLNKALNGKEFKVIVSDKRKVYFTNYDMVQAEIGWVRNAGAYSPELQPTITLFNEYFGGGMSSIVFQTIRESKALAYSSYAYFQTPTDRSKPYLAGAYIGTQADKLDSAIHAMDILLTEMPQSEVLFNTAKSATQAKIESERIIKDRILFNYLASKRLDVNYDIRKDVYDKLPSLDMKAIEEFYKSNISGKPFDLFIVGSKNKITTYQLKKYGPLEEVSLKEIFGY